MREQRRSSGGLIAGVGAGVAATMAMDAAMALAAIVAPARFASDKIGIDVIGRWAAGPVRGQWRHEDISAEPRRRGEVAVGVAAHYLTGITLAETYLAAMRRTRRGPGPGTAVAYGVATAVLPLVVLYPSLGYGCCARRSGDARRLISAMLLGHAAFGGGLALWVATRRRG